MTEIKFLVGAIYTVVPLALMVYYGIKNRKTLLK